MRSLTGITVLLIVGLARFADAAPPEKREDPREVEAMRIAVFRALLEESGQLMRDLPKGSPYCLGFDQDRVARDATPRMIAKLADLPHVLKPLSECERDGLLYKPKGVLIGDYNEMVVRLISRTSTTTAEADTLAFGARCTVQIVRDGKEWAPRRTLGPVQRRVYIGCIS
jgi:hypothetical protein